MSLQQKTKVEIKISCDNMNCKSTAVFQDNVDITWFILRMSSPLDRMTIERLRALPKSHPRASNIRGGVPLIKCFCSMDCATKTIARDLKDFLNRENVNKDNGDLYRIMSTRF